MAALISVHNLGKWQGSRKLFEKISFGIDERANVAMIGPNGAGKTTLLRMLAGKVEADEGDLSISKNCRIAYLEQNPPFNPQFNLLETILESVSPDPQNADIYHEQKAYELISKLGFDDAGIYSTDSITTLSGGWRKKAALARELLREPNLLLLDEPTNHLDIESILWLENFLNDSNFATLTITHDRSFLQNTSSVIIELNKCYSTGFLKIEGDYAQFCEIKSDIISGQIQAEQSASNRLRREMEWMRKSPKARSTKQKARMKQTEELQEIVGQMQYRAKETPARIEFRNHEKAPKKLIEAKNISKTFGDKTVFENFSLMIERKSRIGLIGANGSGKSTLIKALLGREKVDTGTVEQSDLLQLNYFEQDKKIDDSDSDLLSYFSNSGDKVNFCGQWTDVRPYVARFGFSSEQFTTKVKNLSGGEKSRLLLATLMLQESNLLVLDEPTNDLDLTTLNILKDELENYQGALLLVSHDRYFLDQVCDEIYAFSPVPGKNTLTRFADIHQWQKWHDEELNPTPSRATEKNISQQSNSSSINTNVNLPQKKLSFKEKFELENIEPTIQTKEKLLAELTDKLQKLSPADSKKLMEISSQVGSLQAEIDSLYARWEELLN